LINSTFNTYWGEKEAKNQAYVALLFWYLFCCLLREVHDFLSVGVNGDGPCHGAWRAILATTTLVRTFPTANIKIKVIIVDYSIYYRKKYLV